MLIYKCVQTFFALAVVIIYATSNVFAQQDICKAISCLDMGLTPCDRSTETCSPCIYLINGDSYSCYQKENDQCPFPDTIAICDSALVPAAIPSTSPSSTVGSENTNQSTLASKNTTVTPSNNTSSSLKTERESNANKMNTESNESTGKSVGGSSKILSISLIFGALLATASVGLFVMRRIKDKRRKNEAEDLKSIFPKKDLKLQSKNNALKDGDFEYHLQNTGKAHSKSDDFSTAETFMSIPSVFSSYGDFFNQDRLLSYDQYQKNIKKKCTSDISSMKSYSVSKENPSFKIDEYQLDVEEDDSVSTLSDYDIVDPESMQHAEGRNTEALVNEGRFRVLSNASFVSSSAESELDDESVDSPSVSFARELEL